MTEMLKKFLSFMNLTVSNIYFKLMYVDIFVIVFSINSPYILEAFNIFPFMSLEEHRIIFLFFKYWKPSCLSLFW